MQMIQRDQSSSFLRMTKRERERVEQHRVIYVNLSVRVWEYLLTEYLCVCLCVLVFSLCDPSVVWLCLTLVLSLCSIRNASGLTAADLAYAQGFQECAEILSNAQNFQQNIAQSHIGVFLNGMTPNGSHTHPTIQGRSFLNGVTNRKRSFEDTEANPVKKTRPNGMYSHISEWDADFWLKNLMFYPQKSVKH